jgi:hypothetical protein
MKIKFFVIILVLLGLIFLVNAYAHYPGHYTKDDIKVETKKIDKGIQVVITSEDPEIAKEIQENKRYYEDMLAEGDYCPHMERMAYHHGGCRWQ